MIGQNNNYNSIDGDKRRRKKLLWLLLLLLLIIFSVIIVWLFWFSKNESTKMPEKPKVQVEIETPKDSSDNNSGDKQDTIKTNQIVEFPVSINTLGQTINAAEIHLKFNQEEIEIQEILKNNSIFKYWISQQNEYNNTKGDVLLVGSLPSPGFKGIGNVVVIKAIPKKAGNVAISVGNATQVALNDGEGSIAETVTIDARIEVEPE